MRNCAPGRIIFGILGLLSLSACSLPPEKGLVADTDPIALRIAESADKASAALQDLAKVEQTKTPPKPEPTIRYAPPELNRNVTISWVGPAESLVQNIAQQIDYRVVTIGTQPKVPVVVRIEQRDRPVLDALRSIGEQATQMIDLQVDPAARRIDIKYKAADPMGGL